MSEIGGKKPSDLLNSKIDRFANNFASLIEVLIAIDSYGKEQGYTEEEIRDLIMSYLEEAASKQGVTIKEFTSWIKEFLTTRYKKRTGTRINNEYRLRRMLKASAKADKE